MALAINKRTLDLIGRQLHEAKNNVPIFTQVIDTHSLEFLLKTQHNGIISKLLEYFIHMNDMVGIHHIISCDYLMKRDYFHLIKYYYDDNFPMALDIFTHKILQFELLPQDIDYIIDNNMVKLLELMEGMFLETSHSSNMISSEELELKIYSINPKIIDKVTEFVEMQLFPYKESLEISLKPYKYIIDGGSVIHSRNGMITSESLMDLVTILSIVEKPILVIHKRHLKTIPTLLQTLKQMKVDYYLTPYNVNDDLFILWFFLKLRAQCYIITNDKYRDHIFSFGKICDEFKNILSQQTLQFSTKQSSQKTIVITSEPQFSRCIQKIIYNGKPHMIVPIIATNSFNVLSLS
jgi:hypothetical protein